MPEEDDMQTLRELANPPAPPQEEPERLEEWGDGVERFVPGDHNIRRREVETPSGLKMVVRGMALPELDIIADQAISNGSVGLEEIVQACWCETTDTGPYKGMGKKLNVNQLLLGDQYWLTIPIRHLTIGNYIYDFDIGCPFCDDHLVPWTLKLDELKIQRLSEEDRAIFASGKPFESILPVCGRRYRWNLLRVGDRISHRRMAGSSRREILSKRLRKQVIAVEGVDGVHLGAFFNQMDPDDVMYVFEESERHDCGVETLKKFQCDECGRRWDQEMPVGDGFFSQKSRRALAGTSSTNSSTSKTDGG